MAKTTNIFDPIQKSLDQKVFNEITPRPRVVKFILEEVQKVLIPELGFDPLEFMDLYLTGSLTTYQYDETSDCDISVFVQWDLWPTGADPNTIRRTLIPIVMDKLDGTNLPGTVHPIQHFIVPPGVLPHDLYKPGLRSAWSFRDHKWLVPPEKDRVHDISVELPVLYRRAEDMADKMENLLAYDPYYAKEFWHQIHKKRQRDQQKGLGDFSEGNIVYKYLLHNGYFDRIRDELGERISKVSTGLPGEDRIPTVGDVWTISNPWSNTQRNVPARRTVEITDLDDDEITLLDLDTDEENQLPMRLWYDWVNNGRARFKSQGAQGWKLEQSPEEAADLWPDTLPPNWSFVKEGNTLRLFIAFDPPENVIAEIIQWQKQNAPEGVRLHSPENLHMTLAFLGDTDEVHVPELAQIIAQLDPTQVFLSGPTRYEEIRGKQGVLVWDEQGGNEVWRHLNELLHAWNGYTPQYDPWLPHTTVWEYPGGTGEGYTPEIPQIATWSPTSVGLYKSDKNPEGGGIFTKIADDLSWVDKSTPYGTPDGGFIGGPEPADIHPMDLPDDPAKPKHDPEPVKDTPGSMKVIYDYEKDQIILGDVKMADKFPPGQIIGDYREHDVYLNHNAEAWFNAGYFKRLWQHSFPNRPIRHVILDKGDGNHEVVHRHPDSAILSAHEEDHNEEARLEAPAHEEHREEAQAAVRQAAQHVDYRWPEWDDIDFLSHEAVEDHQGYRDPGAIEGAVGNVQMAHKFGAHEDIFDVAADLLYKIQRQQAVVDGNKRTGTAVALHFLEEHGVDTQPLDDYFNELAELINGLDRDTSQEQLATFFRAHLS